MTSKRTNRRAQARAGLALGLTLALFGTCLAPSASGQAAKAERAKEPTDGFFDIPKDPNAEAEPSYGVPAYLVTTLFAGLAIATVCKSARRS